MSSNNMLIILKTKKFQVHEWLCVDNEFFPSKNTLIKSFKTLIEAIKFANKYCQEELVEYGYHIEGSALE